MLPLALPSVEQIKIIRNCTHKVSVHKWTSQWVGHFYMSVETMRKISVNSSNSFFAHLHNTIEFLMQAAPLKKAASLKIILKNI